MISVVGQSGSFDISNIVILSAAKDDTSKNFRNFKLTHYHDFREQSVSIPNRV